MLTTPPIFTKLNFSSKYFKSPSFDPLPNYHNLAKIIEPQLSLINHATFPCPTSQGLTQPLRDSDTSRAATPAQPWFLTNRKALTHLELLPHPSPGSRPTERH